jgi:ribose/xylose/arabinose/galactoside ABC-type transport system permease subunit
MELKKLSSKNNELSILLLKARTFIVLILLIGIFALLEPKFLSWNSIISVSKHVARYAILAIGMTFVIVSGGIDLSVGSVAGLSGMIAGMLIKGIVFRAQGVVVYMNIVLVVAIAVFIGALIGLVNGLAVSKLKVPAFIVTLGTANIARGCALLSNAGATFPSLIGKAEYHNTGFPFLGSGAILGIPVIIWTMIVLAIISAYVFTKTPLGWHVYATGGNEKAAKLSGINTDNTKLFVFIFSAACAALTGVFAAAELEAAHPATGDGWEMNAIAAAVLGGTSMMGGMGNVGGTIIGAFVIGVLTDGMVMMGISSFWQQIIKGIVIIAAVVLDQSQRDLQRKVALTRKDG